MPLFASRLGAAVKHPYSPPDAALPFGYAAPTMPFTVVLAAFFGLTAAGSVATWRFASEFVCGSGRVCLCVERSGRFLHAGRARFF